MKQYWRNPEATASTITEDGWLRSGDGGSLDADGYLYLHDRIKDMIVSGGENVYPADIESVLTEHPAPLLSLGRIPLRRSCQGPRRPGHQGRPHCQSARATMWPSRSTSRRPVSI